VDKGRSHGHGPEALMSQVVLGRLGGYQAELLARLYLHPAQAFALVELAVDVGMPAWAADLELQPLVAAGLVTHRLDDSMNVYQANTAHSAARRLARSLAATHGPVPVVREEFAAMAELELVLIFGEWVGDPAGHHPSSVRDVDVLIVGSPSAMSVAAAAERAEQRLDLPVNTVVRSPDQWALGADSLVAQVQRSGYVTVRRAEF
jgi:hypothetical protein